MPRSLSKHLAQLERGGGRRKRDSFNKWRRYIDAIDFLENLGIANISQASPDEIQFSCPFPDHTHGDENPSASMNNGSKDPLLNTAWTCYGCKRGGNAVTFLAEFENISRPEASSLLKAHYARGYIAPKYGSIAREFEERYKLSKERHIEPSLFVLSWSTADKFEVDWNHYSENFRKYPDVSFMLDRGFSPAVLEEWGIGYDYDSERITIPICDQYGNLVGFKGRAWKKNARPKYLVMGNKGERKRYDFKVYDKSLVVFGLDRWGHVDTYVLVEGELDVIALWCMGIPAISCGGSTMSVEQAKLIREYCDEVVLFFDNDAAGKIGVYGREDKHGEHKPGILELLEPHLRVRVVAKHRYDANEYLKRGDLERVRSLIAGATASHALV